MSVYDERCILILQWNKKFNQWDDITSSVRNCVRHETGYQIVYSGSDNFYWKSLKDIKFINPTKKINPSGLIVLRNGKLLDRIVEMIQFEQWIKIFFSNETARLYHETQLQIMRDLKEEPGIDNIVKYLTDISKFISVQDGGSDFLFNQMQQISIPSESILGKFLENRLQMNRSDNEVVIYPLSNNLSQRIAIKRALNFDLSIIQGPPGTGKTQTILNIVANYILRGASVAVLSGNNKAVENVYGKVKEQGYECLNALLGSGNNIKAFFENTPQCSIPSEYEGDILKLKMRLKAISENLEKCLTYNVEVGEIEKRIEEFLAEKRISDTEYATKEHKIPKCLLKKRFSSLKSLQLSALLDTLPDKKMKSPLNRIRFFVRFGILCTKEIANNREDVLEYLRKTYYDCKIRELGIELQEKKNFCKSMNQDELIIEQEKISKSILDHAVYQRFHRLQDGEKNFTIRDYKNYFSAFVKRYPIIYSTTHAIRSCSGSGYLYDCIIIDESSQVDLITAVIAFSCAKRVVLVGDSKQLPHVVNSTLYSKLREIFSSYRLPHYYNYANNIMECVMQKDKSVPVTLLNEHYRCDPQIIGFCNKRFYNNELIIRTKHEDGNGVFIISHGSHFERNRANEREADSIEHDILSAIGGNSLGIIAPYNNQVKLLKERFPQYENDIDTIHKFQGKERKHIILSTVANKIQFYEDEERVDFLNNPNLINVAISRAKERLYILASEEVLTQQGSLLRDMSKFYEYYCSETKIIKTKVYSVFDLMYDDYSPILEDMKRRLLKVSKFASENIIATVINDICREGKCGPLGFKFNYPLKYVIKTENLADIDDRRFVENIHTHCDFLLFNLLDKSAVLAVEVDGSQHSEEIQARRDRRKDRLLLDAGIQVLRLSTTTINCKEKIISALHDINI